MATPVDLPDVNKLAKYLSVDAPDDHEDLEDVLVTSIELAEIHVGPLDEEHEWMVVAAPGGPLVVPTTHLRSVTKLIKPSGAEVDPASVVVDLLAGIVHTNSAGGHWRVTVKTGRCTPALVQAILIIAGHQWQLRRGTTMRSPRVVANNGDVITTGFGYAVPRRAVQLMAGRLLPGFA